MIDLLTVDEVASLLKISKGQVYEMTKERTRSGDLREHPLPVVRMGRSVRFRKEAVEGWLEKLA